MHVFLTGGTGFIGRHVLDQLGAAGHQVTALCRTPRVAGAAGMQPSWLCKPMDQLSARDLKGVDTVIHLASPGVSPQQADWSTLFYWNVTVLLELMAVAQKAGVRRCVLAGTSMEYGRSADAYNFIPADAPLLPTHGYAASKASGCVAASAFAIENQMELCYLRIFSAFGEGQHQKNFWPALRQAALCGEHFPMTPGQQVRDFIEVERVARAFLAAVERRDVVAGTPWVRNVGSGEPVTMLELATRWWSVWKAPGHLQPGGLSYRSNEIMRFVPEINPDIWDWK